MGFNESISSSKILISFKKKIPKIRRQFRWYDLVKKFKEWYIFIGWVVAAIIIYAFT